MPNTLHYRSFVILQRISAFLHNIERNWLLRCSILCNVAVILYICSNVLSPDKQEDKQIRISELLKSPALLKQNQPEQIPLASLNEPQFNVDTNEFLEDNRFEIPTDETKLSNKEDSIELGNGSIFNYSIINNNQISDLDSKLIQLLNCNDRDYETTIVQRGDFWVLKNYIRADHSKLKCYETITYCTHADYSFLDNLPLLLERWIAPISIALHSPGTDFIPTVNSIRYLRDCTPEGGLIKQFVSFHLYFSSKHVPKLIPNADEILTTQFNCSIPSPYVNVSSELLYKTQKKLLYPVNVGRNIARDAALTHFILVSDIELYPSPGLVHKFLEMIARNDKSLRRKALKVYPLSLFEVDISVSVPKDKTELQDLLKRGKAIKFHSRVCPACHAVPKSKEWIAANETDELGVFHIGKRLGYYVHWEPIYIGTHRDPHYDERLSWEGKSDKMTQGYILCALDYEFHILDNAFLVHKPGIKVLKKDPKRAMLAGKTNQLIKKVIYPELQKLYGVKKGCAVYKIFLYKYIKIGSILVIDVNLHTYTSFTLQIYTYLGIEISLNGKMREIKSERTANYVSKPPISPEPIH
uniref:CSON001446 protein n=2 Tax=Culicoides sonorensis TaxID=179676 RepID=A0A336M367_CULSO